MGLTPSVGDDLAALTGLAKAILDSIAGRRGDDERARFLRVTAPGWNETEGKADKRQKGDGSDFQGAHAGLAKEDKATRIFQSIFILSLKRAVNDPTCDSCAPARGRPQTQ